MIAGKRYDPLKIDIWSSGITLFVMVAGNFPFSDPTVKGLYNKILNSDFAFPSFFTEDLKDLLSKMLDSNPSTRIDLDRIKSSSWMTNNKPEKLYHGKNETLKNYDNKLNDIVLRSIEHHYNIPKTLIEQTFGNAKFNSQRSYYYLEENRLNNIPKEKLLDLVKTFKQSSKESLKDEIFNQAENVSQNENLKIEEEAGIDNHETSEFLDDDDLEQIQQKIKDDKGAELESKKTEKAAELESKKTEKANTENKLIDDEDCKTFIEKGSVQELDQNSHKKPEILDNKKDEPAKPVEKNNKEHIERFGAKLEKKPTPIIINEIDKIAVKYSSQNPPTTNAIDIDKESLSSKKEANKYLFKPMCMDYTKFIKNTTLTRKIEDLKKQYNKSQKEQSDSNLNNSSFKKNLQKNTDPFNGNKDNGILATNKEDPNNTNKKHMIIKFKRRDSPGRQNKNVPATSIPKINLVESFSNNFSQNPVNNKTKTDTGSVVYLSPKKVSSELNKTPKIALRNSLQQSQKYAQTNRTVIERSGNNDKEFNEYKQEYDTQIKNFNNSRKQSLINEYVEKRKYKLPANNSNSKNSFLAPGNKSRDNSCNRSQNTNDLGINKKSGVSNSPINKNKNGRLLLGQSAIGHSSYKNMNHAQDVHTGDTETNNKQLDNSEYFTRSLNKKSLNRLSYLQLAKKNEENQQKQTSIHNKSVSQKKTRYRDLFATSVEKSKLGNFITNKSKTSNDKNNSFKLKVINRVDKSNTINYGGGKSSDKNFVELKKNVDNNSLNDKSDDSFMMKMDRMIKKNFKNLKISKKSDLAEEEQPASSFKLKNEVESVFADQNKFPKKTEKLSRLIERRVTEGNNLSRNKLCVDNTNKYSNTKYSDRKNDPYYLNIIILNNSTHSNKSSNNKSGTGVSNSGLNSYRLKKGLSMGKNMGVFERDTKSKRSESLENSYLIDKKRQKFS